MIQRTTAMVLIGLVTFLLIGALAYYLLVRYSPRADVVSTTVHEFCKGVNDELLKAQGAVTRIDYALATERESLALGESNNLDKIDVLEQAKISAANRLASFEKQLDSCEKTIKQ